MTTRNKRKRTRIHVENVGPVSNAKLVLRDLTVLVGPQASGKSVFLQTLKLAADRGHILSFFEQQNVVFDNDPKAVLNAYYGRGMAGMLSRDKEFVLWIEAHPANGEKEIKVMFKKMDWLKSKLRLPEYKGLDTLTRTAEQQREIPFRWLYKGNTSVRAGSKAARQLAQRGMKLQRSIRVG